MKRTLSVLLLLCMFVSLFSGMAVAVDETEPDEEVVLAESSAEVSFEPKEGNISDVFNSRLYVAKNEAASLDGRVDVKLDLLGATGTLRYSPLPELRARNRKADGRPDGRPDHGAA